MRYRARPFRISFPAILHPAGGALPTEMSADAETEMPVTLAINGISTPTTSVDLAKNEADALLWRCREFVAAGRAEAILELLDINPEFIKHAWVRETYIRLAEEGRLRRAPGRPIGRDKVIP